MNIDIQIAIMKLIRQANEKEAQVWRDMPQDPRAAELAGQTHSETAEVCDAYAKACTEVIASLERLKAMTE